MTEPEIRDLVAGHPFTSGLSPAEVDAIAEGARVVDLLPGEALFREGRPATHAYLVTHGHVGIEVHHPGRGSIAVSTVGAGELLGWSWLLPPHAWHFDATARSIARLVALDRTFQTLGYRETLKRGYAVVRGDGAVVTTKVAAEAAEALEIEFADGKLSLDGAPTSGPKPAAKKAKPKPPPPEQGSLF